MALRPPIQAAVLNSLRDVRRVDTLASVQVGDGAGELENAGDGTGGELQAFEGGVEQLAGSGFEDAVTIQVLSVHGGVGRGGAAGAEALPLDGTGGESALGDVDAGFAGRSFELLEADGRDFDVHVDAVEKGAGDP